MEGENIASRGGHCSSGGGENSVNTQLKDGLTAGDSIWVKVCGDSWWPAQVVNEDTISQGSKPIKKSGGLVLVRLYGSYDYLCVDPVKCRSDFITVLQKNKGSHRGVFKKALKKACRMARSNARGIKLTESEGANPSKDKNRVRRNHAKQNPAERKNDSESSSQCNIVTSKMLGPDVSGMKSERNKYSESPDEDCIAKRKPSRQSSLQKKVMKDSMKASEKVNKQNNRSNVMDKSGCTDANENGTPKTLKRNSSSSDVRDGSQKKLKEDNQNNEKGSKKMLESPRANAASPGRSPELSARRIKVMQSLGLAAPTGSPYLKHCK